MAIICLFGPDGSGKTTLAKKLAERLSSDGVRVRYSWMRGSHTLTSLVSRVLSRTPSFRGERNPYYGIRFPKGSGRLWQSLECMSVLPVILIRFILPHLLGFTVVADRFSIDFVVWVAMTTGDEGFSRGFVARCATHLAANHATLIYVTADTEDLEKRSGTEREFLEREIGLYLSIIESQSLNVHIVETSDSSVDESLNQVLRIVSRGKS